MRITEIFESIQGETSYAGRMTSFIRCTGCPLRCRWCDSQYAYSGGELYSLDEILQRVHDFGWKYVCVTGGEPLAQSKVIPLLSSLDQEGYRVSLETSGALSTEKVPSNIKIILDIKCPSSGMTDKMYWPNLIRLSPHDEVKFVLAEKNDYEWAKEIVSQYELFSKTENILFSPVYGELTPASLVQWMKRDRLPTRLNIQLHKAIWGPNERGV